MTFNSVQYAVFLVIVFGLYRLLPRRAQNALLLVASYVFYGFWDWRFLSLLWISTVVDYLVGRAIPSAQGRKRRMLLAVSMVTNLGILGFFKYFNFFAESFARVLEAVGLNADLPTLRIILPVGISFYTFQTMSYTIDVYRGRMEPTRDFLSFATFVAFFPQLVAGPIERARHLLPQFENDRPPLQAQDLAGGLYLIFIGLFKKVVLADAVAPAVEAAFADAATAGWMQLLVGVYAFALQIYGDFSGYSSIARGSARLFGFDLMINFNQPYLSRNITEFWRTWHISLSTWLRDYLYIPLGGNRGGRFATQRNLMLTMLLGGLWHGAAWVFVIWGGLHGLYLAAHRRFRHRRQDRGLVLPRLSDVPYVFATFHLVVLSWIFFRAADLGQALDYLGGILTLRPGPIPWDSALLVGPLMLAALGLDLAQRGGGHEALMRWRPTARGVVYAACFLAIVVFSGQPTVPFIYFQF